MDEQKKQQIEKRISILSFLLIAAVVAYIIYTIAVLKTVGTAYYVVIVGFLALYWFLTDVLVILLTKGFEGKTPQQVKAYKMYAAMNLAGLAGLGYFAIAISDRSGMLGALVYAFTMTRKRKYREEYLGILEEDQDAQAAKEVQETQEIQEVEEKQED